MSERRPTPPEVVAQVRAMHANGMTGTAIARELGMAKTTVYNLLDPDSAAKTRARKQRYVGECVDCGAPTSGCDGHRPLSRCRKCGSIASGETRKVWTCEAIIAAIQTWADEHGGSPASVDWWPWGARVKMGDEERAARFERERWRWPSAQTVVRAFGSWNSGLEAAGFEPRAAHGGSGNEKRHRAARKAVAA